MSLFSILNGRWLLYSGKTAMVTSLNWILSSTPNRVAVSPPRTRLSVTLLPRWPSSDRLTSPLVRLTSLGWFFDWSGHVVNCPVQLIISRPSTLGHWQFISMNYFTDKTGQTDNLYLWLLSVDWFMVWHTCIICWHWSSFYSTELGQIHRVPIKFLNCA